MRPDRVVQQAGSCSPSLLVSLPASLDAVLGSGLALAERLGAITEMGSRAKILAQQTLRIFPAPQPSLQRIPSASALKARETLPPQYLSKQVDGLLATGRLEDHFSAVLSLDLRVHEGESVMHH